MWYKIAKECNGSKMGLRELNGNGTRKVNAERSLKVDMIGMKSLVEPMALSFYKNNPTL